MKNKRAKEQAECRGVRPGEAIAQDALKPSSRCHFRNLRWGGADRAVEGPDGYRLRPRQHAMLARAYRAPSRAFLGEVGRRARRDFGGCLSSAAASYRPAPDLYAVSLESKLPTVGFGRMAAVLTSRQTFRG